MFEMRTIVRIVIAAIVWVVFADCQAGRSGRSGGPLASRDTLCRVEQHRQELLAQRPQRRPRRVGRGVDRGHHAAGAVADRRSHGSTSFAVSRVTP